MKTYEMDLSEGYDKVKIIKSRDRKDNIVEMICIISPSLLLLILWDYICKGYYRTVSYATSVDSFNPCLYYTARTSSWYNIFDSDWAKIKIGRVEPRHNCRRLCLGSFFISQVYQDGQK